MACYHPLTAWKTETGEVVFWRKNGIGGELLLPCGQCWGCRLERSQQWAIRCVHESKLYKHNSFITLTYSDEHLPENGNLDKRAGAKFMKRLRQHAHREQTALVKGGQRKPPTILTTTLDASSSPATGRNRYTKQRPPLHALRASRPTIRFYMCGEYGEKLGRPHYHICLFNCDFADKKHYDRTAQGHELYTSSTLEKLWPFGLSTIGELTFETAAYTARYVMKKITGQQQEKHYEHLNPETGEIYRLKPEFNEMSRRPGIALGAFEKWHRDWYPEGKVVSRGHKSNTPRYYDKQHKKLDELVHAELIERRQEAARQQWQEHSVERLAVREKVAKAKISYLKRKIT